MEKTMVSDCSMSAEEVAKKLLRGEFRKNSYRADRDILLAGVLQDLRKNTLLLELKVHLRLVGLNLHKDITGLEAVTGLLLPYANVSRGHCRGQSRHADDGVGRESCSCKAIVRGRRFGRAGWDQLDVIHLEA
jgi:hypothetical protein